MIISRKFKFVALKLTGLIFLFFILQLAAPFLTELLLLSPAVWKGQYWRFFTSIFLHGDIVHLLYNSFALAFFGSILERISGHKNFLAIFFITGILANVFSVIFYPASLGASGAIFGVIGALVVMRPLLPIWAFGLPMPLFVAGIVWAVGDVVGTYGFLTANPIDSTGNIAHLSGMFFGLLLGLLLKPKKRLLRKSHDNGWIEEKSMRRWEHSHFGV